MHQNKPAWLNSTMLELVSFFLKLVLQTLTLSRSRGKMQ